MAIVYFGVTSTGQPINTEATPFEIETQRTELGELMFKSKNPGDYITPFFNPYFLAVSFMHCKNVGRVEHMPPAKVNARRAKENKPPLVKYYTLQIDPMREVLRREGASESTGLKRALHICRGHFATYDEKPLFGKIKGTFWVSQHIRGSSKHGIVAKDYSVDAPDDATQTAPDAPTPHPNQFEPNEY